MKRTATNHAIEKAARAVTDRVAKRLLGASRRRRIEVNVSAFNRCRDGEHVLVAGKVLGSGFVTKKVHVYALSFSPAAREKIVACHGTCAPLEAAAQATESVRVLRG